MRFKITLYCIFLIVFSAEAQNMKQVLRASIQVACGVYEKNIEKINELYSSIDYQPNYWDEGLYYASKNFSNYPICVIDNRGGGSRVFIKFSEHNQLVEFTKILSSNSTFFQIATKEDYHAYDIFDKVYIINIDNKDDLVAKIHIGVNYSQGTIIVDVGKLSEHYNWVELSQWYFDQHIK